MTIYHEEVLEFGCNPGTVAVQPSQPSYTDLITKGEVLIHDSPISLCSTYSSYQSQSSIRGVAVRKKWLSQVVGDREAHDGVGGGHEDKDGVPQVEEGGQGPKCFANVGIVCSGFRYRCPC